MDIRGAGFRPSAKAVLVVILLQASLMLPLTEKGLESIVDLEEKVVNPPYDSPPWYNYPELPVWEQFGQNPNRLPIIASHGPDGGSVSGDPGAALKLDSITNPVIDWTYGSYSLGNDALSTPIANLANQITVEAGAEDRCGGDSLFAFIVQQDSNDHSHLRIIEGEDAEIAWSVDLGASELVKSSPVLTDINEDGLLEVLVAYDASGSLIVKAYSPVLECGITGWSPSGTHTDELLWTWSDSNLAISRPSPSPSVSISGHRPTTQVLLADVDTDGVHEAIIAVWNEVEERIEVIALNLEMSVPSDPLWTAVLDQGTHPSDPAYVQTDPSTGYVLITTTDSSTGAIWLWKLDGSNGNEAWSPRTMSNTDGDTNVPHLRLPGPVLSNLDSDSALEVIVTIPTDLGGTGNADGAEFRALEVTDGQTELWSVNAVDGYADAPPLPVDTDHDGVSDHLCWVTWTMTSESFTQERSGFTGCHDVNQTIPTLEWSRNLDLVNADGVLNDEIAVAPPAIMDINGNDPPEILIAFGRGLHAFDGASGSPSGADSNWSGPIEVPHRTWSEVVFADMNGDATYEAVLGTVSVSEGNIDIRPLNDGRSIVFDPSEPDPGEDVSITAFYENSGNIPSEESVDAVLYANGIEIARHRAESMDPTSPSGEGSDASFQATWSGGLGNHAFRLVLDPDGNLSQSRTDNDIFETTLSIVPAYNASILVPSTPARVDPGGSSEVSPTIISTGREEGSWTLSVGDDGLPEGWSWSDHTPGGLEDILIESGTYWSPVLHISAPESATGDEEGYLTLSLTLDSDVQVEVSAVLPVEANRTRGLSVLGPEGLPTSQGFGFSGDSAVAWILIENLGNAVEDQVLLSWASTEWGDDLRLQDPSTGEELIVLNLEPYSKTEIHAILDVPVSAALGENVSTTLQLCVGQGSEQTCDSIDLTFTSAMVLVEPPHRRMVPGTANYTVKAKLPNGVTSVNWSLSDIGMSTPGWEWSSAGNGDLSVEGDRMEISGASGTMLQGVLEVHQVASLQYIQPGFHRYEGASDEESEAYMSFTLEILQEHRASLEMADPQDGNENSIEVGTPYNSMLRMRNSGNGNDQYSLSWEANFVDGEVADGILVSLALSGVALGPGELQAVPISITIEEGVEAQKPIEVRILMESDIDPDAGDFVVYHVSALQDRSWDLLSLTSDGKEAANKRLLVDPGDVVDLVLSVRNSGNYADSLSLVPTVSIDGSEIENWIEVHNSIEQIGIGNISQMNATLSIPESSTNGTIVVVSLEIMADNGDSMGTTSVEFEITRRSAWGASFGEADLEIPVGGSELAIDLIQLGNAPSIPYLTTQIVGQKGWVVISPNISEEMSPGESRRVMLNVTPPLDSVHSLTVDLILRIRDADGSGLTEISIPARVEASRSYSLEGVETWQVTPESGGYPLAWIENTGNAASLINLSVIGLPDGWTVEGPLSVTVASGELRGLPISLIPSSDWDGDSFVVRVGTNNEANSQEELMLEVVSSNSSWSRTPVFSLTMGGSALLEIHGTGPTSNVVDVDSGRALQWDPLGFWVLSDTVSGMGSVVVDGSDSIPYKVQLVQITQRAMTCSLSGFYGSLDAECLIGEGGDILSLHGMLVDDEGRIVDALDVFLQANKPGYLNLSHDSWGPQPGVKAVSVRIYDEYGRLLMIKHTDISIRYSDYWNLGIVGLELDPPAYDPDSDTQRIRVLISREGLQSYDGLDCRVILQAPGVEDRVHIVDITDNFAPEPLIERPGSLEDGIEVSVRLTCSFPWDGDSDSSDDVSRVILAGAAGTDSRSEDFRTGAISAVLVIVLGGVIIASRRSRAQQRELEEMAKRILEERAARRKPVRDADNPVPSRIAEVAEEDVLPYPKGALEHEVDEKPTDDDPDDDLDEFERRLNRLGR
ncbi:MAG: hypothetical protein VXY31_02810 [Candidatus Thermoplasmatota archaeon]|nr:hypothetical protein [Candidatus Thermoplasmatota archaeon]